MSNGDLQYIDMELGLSRVRGNTTIYKKMLQLFLQSKEFAQLEESLAANDIPHSAEVAHGIKGMTGNLGLPALFEISTKLNTELRGGTRDEATVNAYRDILQATISEVTALSDTL